MMSESSQSNSEWAILLHSGVGDQRFVINAFGKGNGAAQGGGKFLEFLLGELWRCGELWVTVAKLLPRLLEDNDRRCSDLGGVVVDLCEEWIG